MTILELILAIVVVVTVARVMRDRYRAESLTRRDDPYEAPETARMREELLRLRERVQVLERVVTDNHGSADLGSRIEQLRDR